MLWSKPEALPNGWLQLDVDLDERRELAFDTKSETYLVMEEQPAYPVDEATARELFPRAFEADDGGTAGENVGEPS